jgi:F0F1-type ATP synthase membrane subunit c/vacuolar-type H+-ATPase subunit K
MTQSAGPVGQIRGTGFAIAIYIVTLGIYGLYWYYKTHQEMKAHSGQGIGGGIALLLAFVVGIVMPYITSSEVGGLYTRRGQQAPVSGATGLWYFPGILIIVGPIIWFVKTNGALNDYWRSLGATG